MGLLFFVKFALNFEGDVQDMMDVFVNERSLC